MSFFSTVIYTNGDTETFTTDWHPHAHLGDGLWLRFSTDPHTWVAVSAIRKIVISEVIGY